MELNFKRYEGNPILRPNPQNQWENLCVLNPAVVFDKETNKFVMVYRAGGDEIKHHIRLGLATSDDGFNFVRYADNPVFDVDENDADGGCVEDPRIVNIDGIYYMTYASRAYAPGVTGCRLNKNARKRARGYVRMPTPSRGFCVPTKPLHTLPQQKILSVTSGSGASPTQGKTTVT